MVRVTATFDKDHLRRRLAVACEICSAPLDRRTRTDTVYCSNRCRQRAYRERNGLTGS